MSSVTGRDTQFGGEAALNEDTAVRVAEYVCGLLEPTEHAQVHVLLSRDDQALGVALAWEEELLSLVDALAPEPPPPALRHHLQKTLGIGPRPAPSQTELLRRRSQEASSADNGIMAAIAPAAAGPAFAAPVTAVNAAPGLAAPSAESPARPVSPGASAQAMPTRQARTSTSAPTVTSAPAPGVTLAPTPAPGATSVPTPTPSPVPTSAAGAATTTPKASDAADAHASSPAPVPAAAAVQPGALPDRSVEKPTERTPRERLLSRKLWVWRLIGLMATAAAIVGFMIPREPPPPPVNIVKVAPTRAAILLAPGTSSTPAWTATFDADGNLMMQPLVNTEVPAGSQTLLWTRSARIPEPRLLGSIDPNRPVQVPAATFGQPADDQLLEITLEADEDAVQGRPNGPILYIGQMTTFGSEAAATGTSADPANAAVAGTARPGNPLTGATQGASSPVSGVITK